MAPTRGIHMWGSRKSRRALGLAVNRIWGVGVGVGSEQRNMGEIVVHHGRFILEEGDDDYFRVSPVDTLFYL